MSRTKKAIFLLHSEDTSFFPVHPTTLIEGSDALALHNKSVSHFPQASASVVVKGACIQPIYDCFIAENFALDEVWCYAFEGGFYTRLTFSKTRKPKRVKVPPEIERLFVSFAESVCFVSKQNTVGVFALGLKELTHLSTPLGRFDFRAGRLQAYS